MVIAIISGLSSADKYLFVKMADEVGSNPESEIVSTPRTLGKDQMTEIYLKSKKAIIS